MLCQDVQFITRIQMMYIIIWRLLRPYPFFFCIKNMLSVLVSKMCYENFFYKPGMYSCPRIEDIYFNKFQRYTLGFILLPYNENFYVVLGVKYVNSTDGKLLWLFSKGLFHFLRKVLILISVWLWVLNFDRNSIVNKMWRDWGPINI